MLTLGQRSVDISALLQAALDRFGRPSRMVADRWREAELRDALDKAGVPPAALEVRGMGYMDGGEDVRTFLRACADSRVTPLPSLLLRSAMAEARTTSDPAGNAEAIERIARRPAPSRSRRCRRGGHPGGRRWCAATREAETAMALQGGSVRGRAKWK